MPLSNQLPDPPDDLDFAEGKLWSEVMIVGEAWGREEEAARMPFVGQSGRELTRILSEAGFNRKDFFITNVINARPQDNEAWRFFLPAKGATAEMHKLHPSPMVFENLRRLYRQIELVKPQLIIAAGNYALWALTQHAGYHLAKDEKGKTTGVRAPSGIMNWRGSQTWLRTSLPVTLKRPIPVLPIIHPAAIMRQWELRARTVHDLRERVPRALEGIGVWEAPPTTILAPPTYLQARDFFTDLERRAQRYDLGPMRLAVDVETHSPMLVCIGFAPSLNLALSLPLVKISNPGRRKESVQFDSYWPQHQERFLIQWVRRILTHKNVEVVGQNFLYDTQYIEEEFGVIPRLKFDTMLAHHLLFPGTPKGLDYLSSLYCEHHLYWKEDGKDWHINDDLASQLRYNAMDCLRTLEISRNLDSVIEEQGLQAQWEETMWRNDLAMRMTRRGVRVDSKERQRQTLMVIKKREEIEQWLLSVFPQVNVSDSLETKWFNSATQLIQLFYSKANGLGLTPVLDRKTNRPSTGKEAVEELRHRYPKLTRLLDAIQALRSLGVFHRNFLIKPLDMDGRMRCSYGPGGTETFRFNSSENAYGRGTNLQNIPTGNEDD